MIRLSGLILVAVLSVLLFGSCAHFRPPAPLVLTPADSGYAVETRAGKTFTVRLPTDLASGYVWQTIEEPDARVAIVNDSGVVDHAVTAPQAPGATWWKLRATGTGTTCFAVRYVKPWEPGKNGQTFSVTIVVK